MKKKDSAMDIIKALAKKGTLECFFGYRKDRTFIWRKVLWPSEIYDLQQRARRLIKADRSKLIKFFSGKRSSRGIEKLIRASALKNTKRVK